MPGQEFGARFKLEFGWYVDPMPMKYSVLLSVIKFFLDTVAHLEMMIGCDRDITGIKEAVDV